VICIKPAHLAATKKYDTQSRVMIASIHRKNSHPAVPSSITKIRRLLYHETIAIFRRRWRLEVAFGGIPRASLATQIGSPRRYCHDVDPDTAHRVFYEIQSILERVPFTFERDLSGPALMWIKSGHDAQESNCVAVAIASMAASAVEGRMSAGQQEPCRAEA
jgi:hypothetical protein